MAFTKDQIDELKANLAVARKRELPFGLCIGKSPETTVLINHKTKDPETLGRQAKKDGETAKIAFGIMTVEGKNLNLSCAGDVPTGMARKTRELLKLVGVKMKVRILDAAGNALEEDGEDENGDSQGAADPLAEVWSAMRTGVEAAMQEASALPPETIDPLRSVWAEAGTLAENGDLGAAIAKGQEVSKGVEAARLADADRQRWEEALPKMTALVEEAVAAATPVVAKINAVWSFAQTRAQGNPPDYGAAVKSITMLVKLLEDSRKAAAKAGAPAPQMAFAGGGDDASPAPPALDTTPHPGPGGAPVTPPTAKLDQAEAALKAVDALIKGAPDPKPADWLAERKRIDGILAPMRAKGAVPDDQKLDAALTALAALDAAIRSVSAESAAWKKSLDLFKLRLVPLDRHAQARAVPQIKPKIDAIKAHMAKAVDLADKRDFEGATTALAQLSERCAEVEDLADGLGHYNAILPQRQKAVAGLAQIVDTRMADRRKAIETLLADAKTLADAGTYAEAIAKLDLIPPLVDEYNRLADLSGRYSLLFGDIRTTLRNLALQPANVRAPFQGKIDGWNKQFLAADISKTKDYEVSVRALQVLTPMLVSDSPGTSFIDIEINASKAFQTALAAFEPQLARFKAHPGYPGIELFVLEMEKDLARARAEAAATKFSTATAILTRSQAAWPAQTKIADAHQAYGTKRDVVVAKVAALKGNPAAATVLPQAEALIANAVTQAQSRDFSAALNSVTEAEKRVADAKAATDAQGDLGKLKDMGALDGMAADFTKAMKVFTDMRANVVSKDPGKVFAALIATADAPAQRARDASVRIPPDHATARTELDAAIAVLEGALPKVMATGPYEVHVTQARAAAAALAAKNADKAFQAAITPINARIAEAEALAKAPTFDFARAEAKLAEAMKAAETAQGQAALWPAIKADRAKTLACKTEINAAAGVAAMMPKRLARIDKLLVDIDAKVTAGDFKGAAAVAREGATLAEPNKYDVMNCTTMIGWIKKWHAEYLPAITGPGKEAIVSEAAKARVKFATFEAVLPDESFDLAFQMFGDVTVGVKKCKRLLAEKGSFEPVRATAAKAIKAVTDLRNVAIENDLSIVVKNFNNAEVLADEMDFFGAERVMKDIPPTCAPLLARAKAWKPYEDARRLAEPRLLEAEAHARAATIQPMLTQIRTRYDAAVTQAEGGDFAAAKQAMTEILAAVKDATAAADNTAKMEDGAGPAGPSLAAIAAAKKLRDQLAAKPEALAARADLDEATAHLKALDAAAGDPAKAGAAYKAATDALTRAEMAQAQARMLGETVKAAKAKIAELKAHPQARYVATETAALTAQADEVQRLLQAGGDPGPAATRLDVVAQGVAHARAMADAQVKYIALRTAPEGEPRLEVLEKHAHRYAIKANIDTMRAKLAEAAEASADKQPEAALKLLEEVGALGQSSLVLADMRANKPPQVADIKAILAGPGGTAELDAMIDTLEPDAQRAVLRVAFEARYGTKLQVFADAEMFSEEGGRGKGKVADGKKPGPDIKRFYQLLADLPSQDVVKSSSMRKFSVIDSPGEASFYNDKTKDVILRVGDPALSRANRIGGEHELGKVDPGCEPANDDDAPEFNWTTSHEVGHSTDDRLHFMDKHEKDPTYGGWIDHGRNLKPIAEALAAHFQYDAVYAAEYLAGDDGAAVPPVPTGAVAVAPEEWERRRIALSAWVDMAQVDNKPWDSNAVAQRLRIGDRVYQQSYPGQWTSYLFAARAKGITGYQFRAPGEWFAEIYAAFHAGKLKSSHPAYGWLSTL